MKKINRLIRKMVLWSLGLTVLCCGTPPPAWASPPERTLSFLSWADYIDPELVKAFETEFQVTLKEVFFETDEEREQKLAYTSGKGYDVVLVGGPFVAVHAKRQWITPLDFAKIPNIQHVDTRWRHAYPQAETYGVPYFWGTLGIAYRTDLIPGTIHSWQQLFRPDANLKGRVGMINDSNDVIGMALKALGHSLNSTDHQALAEVEALLLAQQPYVSLYSTPNLTPQSPMVTGDLHMRMTYNGDALTIQDFNPNIAFVVPEEGTGLWVDYLVIPKSSKKQALALAFINFLNAPKNAARLANYVNYASPNRAARALLSPEHLNNPVIYPPSTVLSRSEFPWKMPPRTERKRNLLFSRVKKRSPPR